MSGKHGADQWDLIDQRKHHRRKCVRLDGCGGGSLFSCQQVHNKDRTSCGRQVHSNTRQIKVRLSGQAGEGDDGTHQDSDDHSAQKADPYVSSHSRKHNAAQGRTEHHAFQGHVHHSGLLTDNCCHACKDRGVDSLKTEYPKLPIQSSVSIDYSSFPFEAADSFSAFSLAASSSSAAL